MFKNKIFLGGTCNGSNWRDKLISMLEVPYFNPIVDDWTPECMEEEIRQRQLCEYVLYVFTPKMTGTYAIAEVVDDSNKQPEKTIILILNHDDEVTFSTSQLKSLMQVRQLVLNNGGTGVDTLESLAKYFNDK